MKFTSTAVAAAALGAVAVKAQSNMSLCDKYTTAALKNNTSENQLTLLTLLVNTAVIGNYSSAAMPGYVPGILANGTADDASGKSQKVSLLKYFDGTLASSNVDDKATSVVWLDGGGAAPLMNNTAASAGKENSNQYALLNHLYQVFGVLLGCSLQGDGKAFPAYAGDASMYDVHKFMNLGVAETTYFVAQVGAAAKSFGVSDDDITTVATALTTTFNKRCAPAIALAAGAPNASQSICIASDCPLADNSNCASGNTTVAPAAAAASSSGSSTPAASGSAKPATSSTAAKPDSAASMFINTITAVGLAGAAVAAAALL